ncbi:MAG: hypothetical protein SXG53_24370, partial [Pseudomonadota bacterium]|nr:hypothetical protein [Pseudomonadota bacterium]
LKNALNATAGLLILLVLLYGADQAYLFPAPKLFVPHTFAAKEGEALRLFTPDGANVPWA